MREGCNVKITYVGGGELLLCSDDCSAALGGVECGFSFDCGLARSSAGAADFAADFGGGFPVVHGLLLCVRCEVCVMGVRCVEDKNRGLLSKVELLARVIVQVESTKRAHVRQKMKMMMLDDCAGLWYFTVARGVPQLVCRCPWVSMTFYQLLHMLREVMVHVDNHMSNVGRC